MSSRQITRGMPSFVVLTQIFAGPLNSEMRRRPSVDYLSLSTSGLGDRSKLSHAGAGPNSPMRERLGGFMGRRRDSTGNATHRYNMQPR